MDEKQDPRLTSKTYEKRTKSNACDLLDASANGFFFFFVYVDPFDFLLRGGVGSRCFCDMDDVRGLCFFNDR